MNARLDVASRLAAAILSRKDVFVLSKCDVENVFAATYKIIDEHDKDMEIAEQNKSDRMKEVYDSYDPDPMNRGPLTGL